MGEQVNELVMNADLADMSWSNLDPVAERLFRKQRLAAALRLFGKFGFGEGVAGHITVRDPIDTETFWVNPMGRSFKLVRVSDLIRVSHDGDVVDGGAVKWRCLHDSQPNSSGASRSHCGRSCTLSLRKNLVILGAFIGSADPRCLRVLS